MLNLSVLIIAKNEELHIGNNIRRLKKFLNPQEIIIIDDFSTDATAKIATELGVKVIQHALNGDFGGQRDYAIKQTSAKWILFLDADEYMTEALGCEIRKALTECDQISYTLSAFHSFITSAVTRYTIWECIQTTTCGSCRRMVPPAVVRFTKKSAAHIQQKICP